MKGSNSKQNELKQCRTWHYNATFLLLSLEKAQPLEFQVVCTSGSSFKTLKQLSRSGWTSPSVTLDGPWSNTKIARKLVWTRLPNRFGSTATVWMQQWILLARHQGQSTKPFMMRFLGSTSVRIMSWFVHTNCECKSEYHPSAERGTRIRRIAIAVQ